MKRLSLVLFAAMATALLVGCSKPKEKHVRMDFKGTRGATARGFWLTTEARGHPETKHEIGAMVPSWKSWEAIGVQYIYIRKLTADDRLEVTVRVNDEIIFEDAVTERGAELIYNPKK